MAHIKNNDQFEINSEKELKILAERIFHEMESDESVFPKILSEREKENAGHEEKIRDKKEVEMKDVFFNKIVADLNMYNKDKK